MVANQSNAQKRDWGDPKESPLASLYLQAAASFDDFLPTVCHICAVLENGGLEIMKSGPVMSSTEDFWGRQAVSSYFSVVYCHAALIVGG